MTGKLHVFRATAALAVALAAAPALAGGQPSEDQKNTEAVWDALNEIKQSKVVDVLGLGDSEEETFLQVYNRWEEVRWEYRERRRVLMEELRLALSGDADRSLSAILDDVDAVDAENRTSEGRLRLEFRQLLSEEQYAKLLLFEHNFNRNLRRLVQEQQRYAAPPTETEDAGK